MPKGLSLGIETAALMAFLCIPAVIFTNYSSLPATIPTHFGLSGAPDRAGDKSTLILLLMTSGFVFTVLTITPFYPERINVLGERTPAKVQAAITMIRVVKLEVSTFFAYLVWTMIAIAKAQAGSLGSAPLLFIAVLLATIAIGLFTTTRNAQ